MRKIRSQIAVDRPNKNQVSNRRITRDTLTSKTNRSASKDDHSVDGPRGALRSSTSMNGKRNMSDVSADEADEPQSAKNRHVSAVHDHADKLSNFEYRCRLCKKHIKCGVGTNSNIRRHLANAHGLVQLKAKSHPSRSGVTFDPFRKRKFDEAAIRCIVRDGRPFREFRREGMAGFLEVVTPGYFGPHERTVQRTIKRLYSVKMFELRERLRHVESVAITADLWKRPKKHHYLCVTVHYVDMNYEIISPVLSFRSFHGRHLSRRIQAHLIRVINMFDLHSKICATITDNGSDIRAATQQVKTFGTRFHCLAHGLNLTIQNGLRLWLKPKEKTALSSTTNSDPSSSFTVSSKEEESEGEDYSDDDDDDDDGEEEEATTSVMDKPTGASFDVDDINSEDDEQESCELPRDDTEIFSSDDEVNVILEPVLCFSFEIEQIGHLLERCRKLINVINKSSILSAALENLTPSEIKAGLVVDMRVRWGSTYQMIQRLLRHRSFLAQLVDILSSLDGVTSQQRDKLLKSYPSDDQWIILDALLIPLEFFDEASGMLSGSHYPSLALAYFVLDSLHFYLHSSGANDVEESIKSALEETFGKYVRHPVDSAQNKLLLMSSLFDPTVYHLITDEDKLLAKKFLQIELNKMNKNTSTYTAITSPTLNSYSSSSSADPSQMKNSTTTNRLRNFRQKCGVTDESIIPTTITTKSLTFKQELAQLEALDKDGHTFVSFWRKHSSSLPILSGMARRFGSIPATSVPSESAFSVAGYIARKTRSSLSAKSLKYSMFLKDKL